MTELHNTSLTVPRTVRRAATGRSRLVPRFALLGIAAALEGGLAFLVILGTAVGYHLLLLSQPATDFDAGPYIWLGTGSAALQGLFAAVAINRTLSTAPGEKPTLGEAVASWTAVLALVLLTAFLLGRIGQFSRVSITAAYIIGLVGISQGRRFILGTLNQVVRDGRLHFATIAVVGLRADLERFLADGSVKRQGYRPVAVLALDDAPVTGASVPSTVIAEFVATGVRAGTNQIVFVGSLAVLEQGLAVIKELRRYAVNLLYAPMLRDNGLRFIDVAALGTNYALRFVRAPLSDADVLKKRVFDIVMAATGLVALAPLLLLVALAIRLESSGPVIYRQARRGFNGEIFMIWKFRSMRVLESGYSVRQAQKDDDRITTVGRLIRATSIDELPQLINVIAGDMSLVGPRPHAVSHDEELSLQLETYAHRRRIKPGITGWAQVNGFRGETSTSAAVEGRTAHDIHYIENWSLLFDIWIIILTVVSPAARRNAR